MKALYLLSGLLAIGPMVALPQVAPVTALKAGRLVDPEAGTTASNQVILIEGSKIVAVGANLRVPEGARVIDLSTTTVLPGLFDCHSHLGAFLIKPQRAYFTSWVHSTAYRMIRGVGFAREMLEAGFTTVRDLGEAGNHGDTDLRRAIEEGFVPGPTMVNAGRPIVPLGGGAPANPEKPDFNVPEKTEADTPEELKKAVWENIHYGARAIKIMVDGEPYIYSAEELRLVVEVAARAGIRVAAHAVTDAGGRNAAEARVASIEHGTHLSPETLALAKDNGVVLVPTPFTPFLIREMGIRLSGMREDEDFRDYEGVHAGYVAALKRIHQSGVTIAFGSDVGVVAEGHTRGQLAISTIESYLTAGVPPADILRALTVNAARLVGVDKERGAIKPGLAADLVATPENPLEDVRTLTRVAFVMKEGKVYKQEPKAAGRRAPTAR